MTAIIAVLAVALLLAAPFIIARSGFVVGPVVILIGFAVLGALLP